MPSARRWLPRRWVIRARMPATCSTPSSPGSACRSLGAVKIAAESFDKMAEAAMGTPWVPRNPRPIAGPEQVREILELAA